MLAYGPGEGLSGNDGHGAGVEFRVCFQASPDNATSQQKRDFQSEVLLSTMEIFHVMRGGHASTLRGECR